MKKIVLASNSPRRKELLSMLGIKFDVLPDNTPEPTFKGLSPSETVLKLSEFKAKNVKKVLSQSNAPTIIIAADTVVAADDRILGKPKSFEDAEEMLKMLSGKSHNVYTGVCLLEVQSESCINFYEKTEVFFKKLDINEIKDYINTGEPMDKAGSYGIQNLGSLFVEKINGDYFNVVGLPVCMLGKVLKDKFGIKIF